MSAYIVDRDHITYLVQASQAVRDFSFWDGEKRLRLTGDELGQMLWDENVKSVRYRYPDVTNLPGPADDDFDYAEPAAIYWVHFKPGDVFSALSCYEYQTCEHPAWEASPAWHFCYALRLAYCRKVTGEDGPWGAPPRQCGSGGHGSTTPKNCV